MTKEQYLDEVPYQVQGDYNRKDILIVMDIYAKEKSIAFADFIDFNEFSKNAARIEAEGQWESSYLRKYGLTDDQVHDLFLDHSIKLFKQ